MMNILKNNTPQFIKVLTGIAGELYSYAPGQILQLTPGARAWPEPFKGWIANRGADPIAVALPDPPEWFLAWSNIKPIIINPETFRTVLPAPPPKPRLLSKAEILSEHHLTAEQFDSAALLGFPRSVSSRSTISDGIVTATEALWHEKHIEQWVARQSVMRLHAEMV